MCETEYSLAHSRRATGEHMDIGSCLSVWLPVFRQTADAVSPPSRIEFLAE